MKHPFQLASTDKSNKLLYVAVKQTLQVFDLETKKLLKIWNDQLDSSYILAKQQQEKISKLKEQGIDKIPKIPKPGNTLPKINNFIRNLLVTDTHVILTTDTDKLCVIFKIDPVEIISLVKRVELSKRPCSIIVDLANENLIVGDKFGDVYKISLDGETLKDDLVPILGHVSMLTSVNNFTKNGAQYLITTDRDEHIKISNYPKSYIIDTFLFEHTNFIATTLVTSDLKLLSGGGDEFICCWDLSSMTLLKKLDLRQFYEDVDEIIVSKMAAFQDKYAIVLEKTSTIIMLDGEFNFFKKIECGSNIVDLFANDKQIIVSLENASIAFINVDYALKIDNEIVNNSEVDVAKEEDIIPLFTVSNLRKYSEKYS